MDYLKDDEFFDEIFEEKQDNNKQGNGVKRKPQRAMTGGQTGAQKMVQ